MGNLGTPDGLGLGEVYKIVSWNLAVGDFNGDDEVNAASYVVWRNDSNRTQDEKSTCGAQSSGQTAGSGSSIAEPATLPEPATLVLLMFAAAWCLCIGRAAKKVPLTR